MLVHSVKDLPTIEDAHLSDRCDAWLSEEVARQNALQTLQGAPDEVAKAVHFLHQQCHAAYILILDYVTKALELRARSSFGGLGQRAMFLQIDHAHGIEAEGGTALKEKVDTIDKARKDILETLEGLFGTAKPV